MADATLSSKFLTLGRKRPLWQTLLYHKILDELDEILASKESGSKGLGSESSLSFLWGCRLTLAL
jgi:hypothetical protein